MKNQSTISTSTDHTRWAVSRWAVASIGGSADVKQLALKGNREARCRPPRCGAWLRGDRVSPPEAGFNLREKKPLSRILHTGLPLTRQRPNPDASDNLKGCPGPSTTQTDRKASTADLVYPVDGRDTAKRGMGCDGNRHLRHLAKTIFVNVGGFQLDV